MGNKFRWLLAGLLGLSLLAYTVTYTVRFTETAVVTRFGQAGEGAVKNEPGLYFKLPYPVDNVTRYDTRVRLVTNRMETIPTADDRQVVVEAFCVWRVADPLRFFQRFSNAGDRPESHYRKAEENLKASLRSAAGLASRYRLDELFGTGTGGSRLGDLEKAMLATFGASADQSGLSLADYGIEAVDVGVTRVVLPTETTKAVFDRMRARQERLAQETESQGQSRAQEIRSKAEADAKKIRAFAQAMAERIRNQGDLEARQYIAQMATNPQLAVFLSNMQFIREAYGKQTTLVVSGTMPGMWMVFPNALDKVSPGQIPSPTSPGTRRTDTEGSR
ncbi:MAG: protease modulator HflC [Phycisphaerales bacterium]|nr:protease modulator HflC [Phycisphaerales bacterium]